MIVWFEHHRASEGVGLRFQRPSADSTLILADSIAVELDAGEARLQITTSSRFYIIVVDADGVGGLTLALLEVPREGGLVWILGEVQRDGVGVGRAGSDDF